MNVWTVADVERLEKINWERFQESEAHKNYLEAEEKLLGPILDRMLELAKEIE